MRKKDGLKGISAGIYVPSDTFIHRLDPRAKIIVMLVLMPAVLFIKFSAAYLILGIYIFFLCLFSRLDIYSILFKIRIYIYMTFLMMIFNIFFMKNGYVLLDLGTIKIYDEPVFLSLQIGIQIFLLTMIMEIFTTTTKSSDIIKGINYMTGKKSKNSEISVISAVSVQFINIIYEELKQIIKIQKSRGGDFSEISIDRIRELFLIIIPLFRLTIRKINNMSEIMEVKNFRINEEKTEYEELKFEKRDFLYMGINFLIIFILFTIFFFEFRGTLI